MGRKVPPGLSKEADGLSSRGFDIYRSGDFCS